MSSTNNNTTSNLQLTLPIVGTSSNWGAAMNANFRKIDEAYTKLQNEIKSATNLLGIGAPYYTELRDNAGNAYRFVYLTKSDNKWQLKFFVNVAKNAEGKIEGSGSSITYSDYTADVAPLYNIPSNIGAFVINETITFDYDASKKMQLAQGDLLVAIDAIKNIGNLGEVVKTFQIYPVNGLYIDPILKSTNNGQSITVEYQKKNYVQYCVRTAAQTATITPAFYGVQFEEEKFTYNSTKKCYELKQIFEDANNLEPNKWYAIITFYTIEDGCKQPFYIDYSYKISGTTKKTINITIDRNLPSDAYCDVCFSFQPTISAT